MRRFMVIFAGQVASQLGSHLAGFALGIWILQETGSMGMFSLIVLATNLPQALIAPLAGAVTDRWDRRPTMLVGLSGSCVCSVALALLSGLGILGPWSSLLLLVLTSCFVAFQVPAFESLTSVLVPPAKLTRANGLVQLGLGFAQLVAPVTAGLLLPVLGLQGLYIIDASSFLVAIAALAVVRVPRVPPQRGAAERAGAWRLLQSAGEGWRYLRGRRGMVALLVFSGISQLGFGMVEVLFTPLILSFTEPQILGMIYSAGGIGFITGSILAGTWRGPRRLMDGALTFTLLQGLVLLIAVAQPSALLAGIGAVGFLLSFTFVVTYCQTIWQRSTPISVQGRVFAFRMMVNRVCFAAAAPLAGGLGDYVFEPMMAADGALAPTLGALIGVGAGRGAALLIALTGVLLITTAVVGRLYAPLRAIEAHERADEHIAGDTA